MKMKQKRSKFVGLWQRALALPSLDCLQKDLVDVWARQAGLRVIEVSERDVGIFRSTRSIVLNSAEGIACFPKVSATDDPQWLIHKKKVDRDASLWAKIEWFAPLWVTQERINKLLQDVEHRSKRDAIRLFEYHASTVYVLSFQAVCIAQLMTSSRSLAEFAPIAREAYLAFYAGHRAASIAALIPVIEGAIRKISNQSSGSNVHDQVDCIINQACDLATRLHFDNMWVPREYMAREYLFVQDERVFVFETFRRWLKTEFFRHTGDYDGITWLNRHLFAHGTSTEWKKSTNFSRLVVALAMLGVIESWHDDSHRVSLLFPEMNEDSQLLWQQAILQGRVQMAMKSLERDHYQKSGRLVPLMPTDDGVALRKAYLHQECIKDLVRPLRHAGWSVNVGEPDESALYVEVVASCGQKKLRVALLYSCATDNKLYQTLAKISDVILYIGAPYQQHQYARGINLHVGPVAGWLPPKAHAS